MTKNDSIKKLFSESAVYSAGIILSRIISFLLIPIYTRVFTETEYGMLSMVYAFLGIMGIILYYGTDAALLNFYVKNPEKRKQYYTSIYLLLIFSTGFFGLIGFTFRNSFSVIFLRFANSEYFVLCLAILFLDILHRIPTLILRAENKPFYYILASLINVILTLTLTIYFVVNRRMGIGGVLYANVIASGSIVILTFPITFNRLKISLISFPIIKKAIIFGFPFLISGIFTVLLNLSDRYLLEIFMNLDTVAHYNLGYKLGTLMQLFVMGFNSGWQPYFMANCRKPEIKENYVKITTYAFIFLMFCWLMFTIWLNDIVSFRFMGISFVDAKFHDATVITPIILLSYVFYGLYLLQLPGLFAKDKTKKISLLMGIGAVGNVLLNLVFIPLLGVMGAALTTLISYITIAVGIFIINRSGYPMKYDWPRLLQTLILAAILFLSLLLFQHTITVKVISSVTYLLFSYLLILNGEERGKIRALIRRNN